ncbi:formylmethanofuran dehydrogenase subunit C [uncultured Methylibium sp.]|uniref:formylmethanofuran dehydrogenase subunit C n=1 Tax=uncultured Methylibium sp. TaxID=381093 RepID=UPI0025F865AA|nr:formylmethanofuran dehydrogenase subunit C [uncultured Methylibium sp.]
MSGWKLTLKSQPALRVDLRSLSPAAFADSSAAAVGKHVVHHGNEAVALGDLFTIAPHTDGELRLEGDLSRFDRIGWQLAGGTIRIEGTTGDYLGAGMSAGEVHATGNAGMLAACEMSGGRLEIGGDAGDCAASGLPGSMDGMRGGTLLVRGSAGQRFGDRMRRGTALVFGDAGDFCASRMVAGTIAVGGRLGAHPGYGMRRGTLLALGPAPTVPPTFAATNVNIGVFWQLLARDLARHGGVFATLGPRCAWRHVGDLAAGGKGELLILSP